MSQIISIIHVSIYQSICDLFKWLVLNGAPRALIAKTKSNQSQEREVTLVEAQHSCLMSRY